MPTPIAARRRRAPTTLAAAIVLAALAPLAGCDAVESSEIATADTMVHLDVDIDEAGQAEALAQLTTDNPALLEVTFLDLEDGDALHLSTGGERQRMEEQYVVGLNIYQYGADLDDVVGGEDVIVAYERRAGRDARATHVRLPGPIALDAAPTFVRGDGLAIAWLGGGDASRIAVSIRSECIEDVDREVGPDAGGLELAPSELRTAAGADPTLPCPLDLEVQAIVDGEPDPAFRGGTVRAGRSSARPLTAMP